jgi:hypothetical protein
MENKKYGGPDRRRNLRVVYEVEKRPVIHTGEYEFEIADISERGLRFFNEKNIDLGNWVKGTVTLLAGDSIDVDGMVVRKTDVDIYMNVNDPIAKETILKEKQIVDNQDTDS